MKIHQVGELLIDLKQIVAIGGVYNQAEWKTSAEIAHFKVVTVQGAEIKVTFPCKRTEYVVYPDGRKEVVVPGMLVEMSKEDYLKIKHETEYDLGIITSERERLIEAWKALEFSS